MSIQEVSAEQLAKLFHYYHHALGPDFGCTTNSTPESLEQVTQPEKNRIVAAARLAMLEVASTTVEPEDLRRYFAKAGGGRVGLLAPRIRRAQSSRLDRQKGKKIDKQKAAQNRALPPLPIG
jgi:hypothetical protein